MTATVLECCHCPYYNGSNVHIYTNLDPNRDPNLAKNSRREQMNSSSLLPRYIRSRETGEIKALSAIFGG